MKGLFDTQWRHDEQIKSLHIELVVHDRDEKLNVKMNEGIATLSQQLEVLVALQQAHLAREKEKQLPMKLMP